MSHNWLHTPDCKVLNESEAQHAHILGQKAKLNRWQKVEKASTE